jgi:hypothetical protein
VIAPRSVSAVPDTTPVALSIAPAMKNVVPPVSRKEPSLTETAERIEGL